MATKQVSTNLVKLTVKTQTPNEDVGYFVVDLKYPIGNMHLDGGGNIIVENTDTMLATINEINNSLSGDLNGMWLRDKLPEYVAKKIVKAKLFQKTVTTPEDGLSSITWQLEHTFYKDPEEYPEENST